LWVRDHGRGGTRRGHTSRGRCFAAGNRGALEGRDGRAREPVANAQLHRTAADPRPSLRSSRGDRVRLARLARRVARGGFGATVHPKRASFLSHPRPSSVPVSPPSRPLRIAITCYPSVGGSGVLASAHGVELARRGHAVQFVSHGRPYSIPPGIRNAHFH